MDRMTEISKLFPLFLGKIYNNYISLRQKSTTIQNGQCHLFTIMAYTSLSPSLLLLLSPLLYTYILYIVYK